MNIVLTPLQLQTLLSNAAQMGAELALTKTGQLKPYLNESEAFAHYGRKNVEHWISLGLIALRRERNTSEWCIDRIEIEAVSKSRDAMRFL
ncbi:hypothetical protein [Sphingobacterium kitahiroshimense]|uniref:Uncharacterized protein n=1 Tax=Sphingobacterium kitahiroshimense TaxID=470446 RepID=A0ABV0BMX5_9SPHI